MFAVQAGFSGRFKGISQCNGTRFARQQTHQGDCLRALRACVEIYRSLRPGTIEAEGEAEKATIEYLSKVGQGSDTAL